MALLACALINHTAPAEVRQLESQLRVPAERLRRPNETRKCNFCGMCAGASANELFLADFANGVLRILDVRTGQLDELDVHRCAAGESLTGVAFSAHTDTLFVATLGNDTHTVRSFARTNAEWRECHRLDLSANPRHRVSLRALSDGSLVIGVQWFSFFVSSAVLQMLAVDDSRAMQTRARIRLPAALFGFDAQLAAGETRLALALYKPAKAVALFRVVGDRAEELARCPLECLTRPLFCRDSLLALVSTGSGWTASHVVQELCTEGGRLESRRVLLSGLKNSSDVCWCVVNDSLLASWGLEDDTPTLNLYNIR